MSIESQMIAWLLSLATAACFAWLAHRAGRNRFGWAFAGWAWGLAVATVILGLAEASFIPISPNGYFGLRLKATVVAVLLIAGASVLFGRTRGRT